MEIDHQTEDQETADQAMADHETVDQEAFGHEMVGVEVADQLPTSIFPTVPPLRINQNIFPAHSPVLVQHQAPSGWHDAA